MKFLSLPIDTRDHFILKKFFYIILFCFFTPQALSAEWFFRGTPNNWSSENMQPLQNNLYVTCAYFDQNSPRFKIDRFGDWSESYPRNDFIVEPQTHQLIFFSTNNKSPEAYKVQTCDNTNTYDIVSQLKLPRGPYLQTLTNHSVIVKWNMPSPGSAVMRYGTDRNSLEFSVTATSKFGNQHTAKLENLLPETKYYYAIGYSSNTVMHDEHMYFETAPVSGANKKTNIWVIGDSGVPGSNVTNMYNQFLNRRTEYTHLWLMLGDNAYSDGRESEYQRSIFEIFPDLLKQTALWPTYGNHDAHQADAGSGTGPYFDLFDLPTQGEAGGVASGTEAYFSFDYGNIHFINLDSAETAGRNRNAMINWLRRDLEKQSENNQTKWIIAFFHHPPYSKGTHDSDDARDVDGQNNTWGGESEMKIMRENFLPILEKYNVDLVLSGHSHGYERSKLISNHYQNSAEFSSNPSMFTIDNSQNHYIKDENQSEKNGTIYVVAGNAAKNGHGGQLNHPVMATSTYEIGSLMIQIDGNQLSGNMLTKSGQIFDQFTITK